MERVFTICLSLSQIKTLQGLLMESDDITLEDMKQVLTECEGLIFPLELRILSTVYSSPCLP